MSIFNPKINTDTTHLEAILESIIYDKNAILSFNTFIFNIASDVAIHKILIKRNNLGLWISSGYFKINTKSTTEKDESHRLLNNCLLTLSIFITYKIYSNYSKGIFNEEMWTEVLASYFPP